jgi:hypothetical protein
LRRQEYYFCSHPGDQDQNACGRAWYQCASRPSLERPTEEIVDAESCVKDHQKHQQKIKIEQHTFTGGLWFAAWLFTIGYLHLSFWKGVLALIIWPYFIGTHASTLLQ